MSIDSLGKVVANLGGKAALMKVLENGKIVTVTREVIRPGAKYKAGSLEQIADRFVNADHIKTTTLVYSPEGKLLKGKTKTISQLNPRHYLDSTKTKIDKYFKVKGNKKFVDKRAYTRHALSYQDSFSGQLASPQGYSIDTAKESRKLFKDLIV